MLLFVFLVPIFVICRRGNDSQLAVPVLEKALYSSVLSVSDIRGGLTEWRNSVDKEFPLY